MAKPNHAPASNDAYTGLLAISLLALAGACVLLFLDYSQYPETKPPAVHKTPFAQKFEAPIQKPVEPVPNPNPNPAKDEGKDKGDAIDKGEEKKDDAKK